jgi:hypothetical protein
VHIPERLLGFNNGAFAEDPIRDMFYHQHFVLGSTPGCNDNFLACTPIRFTI